MEKLPYYAPPADALPPKFVIQGFVDELPDKMNIKQFEDFVKLSGWAAATIFQEITHGSQHI